MSTRGPLPRGHWALSPASWVTARVWCPSLGAVPPAQVHCLQGLVPPSLLSLFSQLFPMEGSSGPCCSTLTRTFTESYNRKTVCNRGGRLPSQVSGLSLIRRDPEPGAGMDGQGAAQGPCPRHGRWQLPFFKAPTSPLSWRFVFFPGGASPWGGRWPLFPASSHLREPVRLSPEHVQRSPSALPPLSVVVVGQGLSQNRFSQMTSVYIETFFLLWVFSKNVFDQNMN